MKKILITGAGGFLGARVARTLLANPPSEFASDFSLTLTDQYPLPPDLSEHPRVTAAVGPMLQQGELFASGFDGVFHLASAVSGECELDFELGLRSNLDSTRLLLEGLRRAGNVPRVFFSSSVAVYGPDPALALPSPVSDNTLPAPQTSYGTHKLMCEYLIADYTRKGFVDGRSARLMTVTVRPGQPNGAASSFFSGILREPLAGQPAVCPVETSVAHPVSSPGTTVASIIGVFGAPRALLKRRLAINLPALNVTVAQMLNALEEVAGKAVRQRVVFEHDARIASIVANWPQAAAPGVATEVLGLQPDANFASVIEQYISDMRAHDNPHALKGLA